MVAWGINGLRFGLFKSAIRYGQGRFLYLRKLWLAILPWLADFEINLQFDFGGPSFRQILAFAGVELVSFVAEILAAMRLRVVLENAVLILAELQRLARDVRRAEAEMAVLLLGPPTLLNALVYLGCACN